ncbi:MAG: hypothetical protein U9Q81_15060, partial [Pseudomonadota bacterium]|nr:hypothetical protein [Pseudomonadota bacterium]
SETQISRKSQGGVQKHNWEYKQHVDKRSIGAFATSPKARRRWLMRGCIQRRRKEGEAKSHHSVVTYLSNICLAPAPCSPSPTLPTKWLPEPAKIKRHHFRHF